MRLKGKLLVVPFWLVEYIKVHGLNWSVLKNLLDLQDHFSTNDLIEYVTANMYLGISSGKGTSNNNSPLSSILDTFEKFDLVGHAKAKIQDNPKYDSIVSNIENNALVNFNIEVNDGVNLVRFLTNRFTGNCGNSDNYNYVWSCFKIDDKTFGITLMPIESNSLEVELKQIEDIVQLLLTHFHYNEVANTSTFKYWLKQLSNTV